MHVRVFRYLGAPSDHRWYVDIDDADDQRPDDPIWFGYFRSQHEAIDAACNKIAALRKGLKPTDRLARISDRLTHQAA
ncbi:hypothetical protein G3I17_37815 [Streptomyces sp. SID13031]|nr:hypothetical protein [Streptomyces sp. SID13031]